MKSLGEFNRERVKRKHAHRQYRKVVSGSYPLYRLIALALIVTGILQMVKTPASIVDVVPAYYRYVNAILLMSTGSIILVGLYLRKDIIGLYIERAGVILGFAMTVATTIAIVYNSGLPVTQGTWMSIAFGGYCFYRFFESSRDIRSLEMVALELKQEREAREE